VIIIIGGGIAGLAAAYELTIRRIPFVLLEATDRLGGLIQTEHADGFTIDAGADSILVQKPAALQLCEELGLASGLLTTTPPRTAFVLKRSRLHPLPSLGVLGIPTNLSALAKYDLLGTAARLRVALEPFVPRRPRSDESVASFFRRRFGRAAVDLIADPLLGGIHAGDVTKLSMPSVFPRLTEAEQKPGGVIRNLARTSSTAEDGLFRALPGGMGELVAAIERHLPVDAVRLRTPVVELVRTAPGWRIQTEREPIDGDAVIIAAPAHAAAKMLARIDPPAAGFCASVAYVSTVSVSLGFRRSDIAHPLVGSGFVVARKYNDLRITASTWVSSKWTNRAPAEQVLLRAFLGGAHDPAAIDLTDDDLVGATMRDLAVVGISGAPTLTRVVRWRNAGAQHTVGHRGRMAGLASRLRRLPGLFVTGSGYHSIGIPDCVAHGRQIAADAADYVTIGSSPTS
jgi:protoporphyrinogen/coproporphyrinogen III oxidase